MISRDLVEWQSELGGLRTVWSITNELFWVHCYIIDMPGGSMIASISTMAFLGRGCVADAEINYSVCSACTQSSSCSWRFP